MPGLWIVIGIIISVSPLNPLVADSFFFVCFENGSESAVSFTI